MLKDPGRFWEILGDPGRSWKILEDFWSLFFDRVKKLCQCLSFNVKPIFLTVLLDSVMTKPYLKLELFKKYIRTKT